MKLTFSNPRLLAEFSDWPMGGSKRGRCVFQVHRDKRGWRVSRTTTGKPKFKTYGGQVCIADGSDGRTYIVQHARDFPFVQVSRSDFMTATQEMGRDSAVFDRDGDAPLFAELMALIVKGGSLLMGVENAKP